MQTKAPKSASSEIVANDTLLPGSPSAGIPGFAEDAAVNEANGPTAEWDAAGLGLRLSADTWFDADRPAAR